MWRRVGDRLRLLRRHLGLTQVQLAAASRVTRAMIQRVEAGHGDEVPGRVIDRLARALDAHLQVTLLWQGAALDRLADAGHAKLQNAIADLLRSAGWLVAVEVSFNHYGDRGRCDVVAFHQLTGILLVVEVKTSIGDLQDLLGRLDVKARLGRQLAAAQGWANLTSVVRAIVLADERNQHRIVAAHKALFGSFAIRGQAARGWLRRPRPVASGLLIYLPMPNARLMSIRRPT